MTRSVFVRRQIYLVVTAVIIMGAITALVYAGYARRVFAGSKALELDDSAQRIAAVFAAAAEGNSTLFRISEDLKNLLALDAQIVIYDSSGAYFPASSVLPTTLQVHKVLSGVPVADTGGTLTLTGNLVVGRPIMLENGSIIGAVFLIQNLTELAAALNSMNLALLVSMMAAVGILLVPTYIGARLSARPLYQMRNVALRMARGDFSTRANDHAPGEYGELAATLNLLSNRLSTTISALELERSRLMSILDGLGEGILAIDANGHITHHNPALMHMFGHDSGDLLPARQLLIADESLWADFDATVQQCTPMVRSLHVGDVLLRVTITPLVDAGGNIEGAVGLFRDVTEQERLEQTRRDYVANVSHELRTPLSSVRGLAEALKDGLIREETDRQRYYGYILRETLRLSRLIEDLLELSRLQSGKMALQVMKTSSCELLQDFYERYRQITAEVGIAFALEMPEICPELMTNPDRIDQVLVILLDNAIKFTPADGSITLRMLVEAQRVRIEVSDTGSGIAPEDIGHVFDRFYKADRAHTGQGTGLGLSIAREIMQHLGESIGVHSQPGQGATFWFTVRRADAPAELEPVTKG